MYYKLEIQPKFSQEDVENIEIYKNKLHNFNKLEKLTKEQQAEALSIIGMLDGTKGYKEMQMEEYHK